MTIIFGNLAATNAKIDALTARIATLEALIRTTNTIGMTIMTTQAELAASIEAISAQVTKVSGEINGKIAALEAALTQSGAVPLTANQQAALDSLTATVNALDAIVPDAVV